MMLGGVVSLTVIVCVQVALLPEVSVAVQVRVITLLQLDPGLLWVSANCTGVGPSQLSLDVTAAGDGTWLKHWKLAVGTGQPLRTGA
jgi:hypothetical protein